MSRSQRIELEGALYYVTSRTDRGKSLFADDHDRFALLTVIGQASVRFDAVMHAYCLLNNHFHLVLQTRKANLWQLIRYVNGTYTQRRNHRHHTSGPIFQGGFHAVLVERDAYFLGVCRCVDLNPVRAGLVVDPDAWVWSSYRAHVGCAHWPQWLHSADIHRALAPESPANDGPQRYAAFVAQGRGVTLWGDDFREERYLGSESFAQSMRDRCEQASHRAGAATRAAFAKTAEADVMEDASTREQANARADHAARPIERELVPLPCSAGMPGDCRQRSEDTALVPAFGPTERLSETIRPSLSTSSS